MKALLVSELGPDFAGCALAELPDPVRTPGQVLIRVRAASLNFPDLLMTEGRYQLKPDLPFVPGMEVAGDVIEADSDSGFAPGDAVVAGTRLGGFAELVAVDARSVRRLPANLDFAAGASVGAAYNTAYVSLVRCANVQPGEWVLVHGATGGVGLAAVDLAKALGARVIATSRSPDKLATLAADYMVDAALPAPGFREAVKQITGGGADVIFDPVGGEISVQAFRSIAWRGRHLVVGFAAGAIPALPFNLPLLKGGALLGVDLAQLPTREPELQKRLMSELTNWLANGELKPVVGRVFALEEFREAFRTMQTRGALGKMVVRIST